MTTRETIAEFIDSLPLCRAFGIYLDQGDTLQFVLPYSEGIIGDPSTGVVHGGAISTLLDTACGAVTYTHPENTVPTATIDLRIDYMRPARPNFDIRAEATVYQTTRHVAFLRGVAWDETREKPIATATGTFVFGKADK